MRIKVPFIRKTIFGNILKQRNVDFVFNIATLEAACERLKIDFHEMSNVDNYDFALAVLYEAYLQGCKQRYKKPKYSFHRAVFWNEYMSRESSEQVKQAMIVLLGKMKKGDKGSSVKKK